jgi:hypothetical protein
MKVQEADDQVPQKLPVFYGIRRFIAVFTRVTNYLNSEPDESSPNPHILFNAKGTGSFLLSTIHSY